MKQYKAYLQFRNLQIKTNNYQLRLICIMETQKLMIDFEHFHSKGLQKKLQNQFRKAYSNFVKSDQIVSKCIQLSSQNQDQLQWSFENYVLNKIQMAKTLTQIHRNQLIKQEKQICHLYLQCQNAIKYKMHHSSSKKLKLLYKLYSNMGYYYSLIAQEEQEQNLDLYIDKSLDYHKQAWEISIEMLIFLYKRSKDDQIIEETQVNYISQILNMLSVLCIQSEKRQNISQIIYETNIEICQKVDQFVKMSKNKSKLKQNIAKTYYYRGISLMHLERNREALKYLVDDYNYCRKKNYRENMQKTKTQLIIYYSKNQNFQQLQKLLNTEQKQLLKKEKKSYQSLKNKQLQISKILQSSNHHITPQQIQNFMDQILDYKWYKFAQNFIQKNIHKVHPKHPLHLIMNSYAAEVYYIIKDYTKGFNYQKIALSSITPYSRDHIQQYNQHIHFLYQMENTSIEEYLSEFNRINKKVYQVGAIDQDLYEQNKKIPHKIRKMIQRKNYFKQFINKDMKANLKQRQLFKIITQMKNLDKGPQTDLRNNLNNQKTPFNRMMLKQKYHAKCIDKNIPIRSIIVQKISRMDNNQINTQSVFSLEQLFQCQQEQLVQILKLFRIQKWDFRNFRISQRLFSIFQNEQINLQAIEQFKISNSFAGIEKKLCVIKKLKYLELIQLQNISFMKKEVLYDKLPSLFYQPNNLKIMKLKNCSIYDNFLPILQQFKSLIKLNLSNNFIKGLQLKVLTTLSQLTTLNLSGNCLKLEADLFCQKTLLKFKLKSLKTQFNISEMRPYIMGSNSQSNSNSYIFEQLYHSKYIDLSENSSNFLIQLLNTFQEYYFKKRQYFYLNNIHKLTIKKVNVNKQLLDRIHFLSITCPNLEVLDMRFSYWQNTDPEQYILTNQKMGKTFELKFGGRCLQPYDYDNK